MSFMHIQALLPDTSGVPEDGCVNNWYTSTSDPVGGPYTQTESFVAALNAFYLSIGLNIDARISRIEAQYKIYDLANPMPNPPVDVLAMSLGTMTPGSVKYPAEMALVGSFYSPAPPGTIPARRRGRVYIGPLAAIASTDLTRPQTASINRLVGELDILRTASNAQSGWKWCTFSRADAGGWLLPGGSGQPNLQAAMHPVVGGWVDDAWDVQRRRGLHPSQKWNFGIPQNLRLAQTLPEGISHTVAK